MKQHELVECDVGREIHNRMVANMGYKLVESEYRELVAHRITCGICTEPRQWHLYRYVKGYRKIELPNDT
jgi:hypothetical protein